MVQIDTDSDRFKKINFALLLNKKVTTTMINKTCSYVNKWHIFF